MPFWPTPAFTLRALRAPHRRPDDWGATEANGPCLLFRYLPPHYLCEFVAVGDIEFEARMVHVAFDRPN